ncbi:unnamed protein product [Trypanosoma congolense IL3000]|uniref:WGS project CAEQ00000000 data, annotated contig 153 n=1 Tax=Trypanosoma congolense (strain IL3000) TaxID=1068625 RepID=F9W6W2_TRYCI|nr:unnamed protein product [Trypanosoma congolense IL3000]
MKHGSSKRPRRPAPSDCCGSGCTRCVWDVYFDDVMKYNSVMGELEVQDDPDGDDSHDEEDELVDYVGAVVVKYVDPPSGSTVCITPEVAVTKILGRFSNVADVQLLKRSSDDTGSGISHASQGIYVVNVILDEPATGDLATTNTPLPGDVVEILSPNDHDLDKSDKVREVEALCKRLDVSPDQWCELHRSPFVPPDHFPPWLPLQQPIQIRTLLAFFVDIRSCSYILRPTFLQLLLRVATANRGMRDVLPEDASDSMNLLRECASDETAPLIHKFIVSDRSAVCYPRLIDILSVFPFVKLPLARLLEVSGPLRSRKFSVVDYTSVGSPEELRSNQLQSIQLCLRGVNVSVEETARPRTHPEPAVHIFAELLRDAALRRCANESEGAAFTGHVSHPLLHFRPKQGSLPLYIGTNLFGMSPFAKSLSSALRPVTSQLCTYSPSMVLPLVMFVGAGTGIAPLMNAVNELLYRHKNRTPGAVCIPRCWVIYGARNLSELIFHDQLREALRIGAITRYDVAISRSDEGNYPKHVTDVLNLCLEEVRSELLERGARLFVCGPLEAMRSLRRWMVCTALPEAGDDESMTDQRVRFLENKGQLMFDVWGSVNIFE